MSDFVRARGRNFELSGQTFFAYGVNCYYLGFCSEAVQVEILDQVAAAGMNTVRAWAFCDVEARQAGQPAFQFLADGKLHFDDGPEGLERLDCLIHNAERAGVYLLLPFLNYWPDFGGVPFYRKVLGLSGDVSEFFGRPQARLAYQRWVEHLLTRRNTRTGRLYIDEPSVLGWELGNEPRCPANPTIVVAEWVEQMSSFIKNLDSNHLVAVGDEGFFSNRGRSHLYDGRYGVDTEGLLQLPSIDFGTYHLYPEHWGLKADGSAVERWISDHLQASFRLNRPVVLEEFGSTHPRRETLYGRWIRQILEGGGAGALAWMLGSNHPEAVGFQDKYVFFKKDFPLLLT